MGFRQWLLLLFVLLAASPCDAQQSPVSDPAGAPAATSAQPSTPAGERVTCSSKLGDRTQCAADTSAGVVLLRSIGEAPCLLGKTWGYDQSSVWVADGCSGEFLTVRPAATQPEPQKPGTPRHVPNVGFLLFDGD